MSTFQTEVIITTGSPSQFKNADNLSLYDISKNSKGIKYISAVLCVIILTILIVHFIGPSRITSTTSGDNFYVDNTIANTTNDGDNADVVDDIDSTILDDNENGIIGIQTELNDELNKWFNPTKDKLDTQLASIEFQYYFHPTNTSRNIIVDNIKSVMPYYCHDNDKDDIIVVQSLNTLIGNDIKALRQRKNLIATKSKKQSLYDRTVKVIISDINNFEERGKYGIPSTKPKHSESNVIQSNKDKYEVNRMIIPIQNGYEIEDTLSYSSTVEFNDKQNFVDIKNQKDINNLFDNVYSSLPSDFETDTQYLSWTEFKCDIRGEIGEMKFEVQLCYMTKDGALIGDGELDAKCAYKISYKIDGETNGSWNDYEQLQNELARILPFVK